MGAILIIDWTKLWVFSADSIDGTYWILRESKGRVRSIGIANMVNLLQEMCSCEIGCKVRKYLFAFKELMMVDICRGMSISYTGVSKEIFFSPLLALQMDWKCFLGIFDAVNANIVFCVLVSLVKKMLNGFPCFTGRLQYNLYPREVHLKQNCLYKLKRYHIHLFAKVIFFRPLLIHSIFPNRKGWWSYLVV